MRQINRIPNPKNKLQRNVTFDQSYRSLSFSNSLQTTSESQTICNILITSDYNKL